MDYDPNSPGGAYAAAAEALQTELNLMRSELGEVIEPLETVPHALGEVVAMASVSQDNAEKSMLQANKALRHLNESDASLANGTIISLTHSNTTQASTDSREARSATGQLGANMSQAQELFSTGKTAVANSQSDTESDLAKLKGYALQLDQVIGTCGQAAAKAVSGGMY